MEHEFFIITLGPDQVTCSSVILSNSDVVAVFFFKVWQCDGTFLGVVQLSDMVVRPSGIHLTSDNRLLISNYLHHQVKVYQLELK